MSYAALPTPAIADSPNVPSDLGKVAAAVESQALAQYNVYNAAGDPSATSIESRITAMDASSTGTVAVLEGRISALSGLVNTWTAGTNSNIALQAARTNAFPSRQDSQDTTMTNLNNQLNGYEPQILNLAKNRAAGTNFVVNRAQNNAVSGTSSGNIFSWHTFRPRAGTNYYRASMTGTVNVTGSAANQSINLSWYAQQGTNIPTDGTPFGQAIITMSSFYPYIPIACFGCLPLAGDGSTQWTISLVAFLYGGSSAGCTLTGVCAETYEDLGPHF